MRQVKTLAILMLLFPTTTFAENFGTPAQDDHAAIRRYATEAQKLNSDSDQIKLALLNRGTSTGTMRGPASTGFQVTLIKRVK